MTGATRGQQRAHPPETVEGWYALHDTYRAHSPEARSAALATLSGAVQQLNDETGARGWSCLVSLIGGPADFLAIHLRERPEQLEEARWKLLDASGDSLERGWSLLSVTEAGLYHLTADVARESTTKGDDVGGAEYTRELQARVDRERQSEHVQKRLFPPFPEAMPYVSFYPMSKRRLDGQNWYGLDLDERSRLMQAHGVTGRKYAGRVQQIITGAIGLAEWEWGVTLFASDLLSVKKLVTEMRFDEVSAKYAEFGDFYVGRVIEPGD